MSKITHQANADVFTAIAHPVRRQILDYLAEGDMSVKSLAGHFEVSRPAISQHLAILHDVGLVSIIERGRQHYYHLEAQKLADVDMWLRQYERFLKNAAT